MVGGVRITETGADLALLLAVLDRSVIGFYPELIVFGELGLTGELRPVLTVKSACAKQQSMALNTRSYPFPIGPRRQ